jgi:hypothetical protein
MSRILDDLVPGLVEAWEGSWLRRRRLSLRSALAMGTFATLELVRSKIHFGRTVGSPPGLPGGGMIGIVPTLGVGALMSGSILGGQRTPSVRLSFSLKVWLDGSRGCNAVPLSGRKRSLLEHAFGSGIDGARGA